MSDTEVATAATAAPTREQAAGGQLARNALGMWSIFFFVIAAAAPLTVMAGASPLAFRLGGVGAPGAYVFAGIVYVFFAVGFTAMSQHMTNAGAFYAYITRGLGRPIGMGAAILALIAYSVGNAGFFGAIGFFAQLVLLNLAGIDTPWQLWAYLGIAVVAFLGYRQVEIGARVLGIIMACEVGILLIVAVAVLIKGGPEPVSVAPFLPKNIFAGGAGAMFVLAFGAFIGFEGTAIYAEEARDPFRTIPRATYVSVGFLALFYGFITWTITIAYGAKGIVDFSLSDAFQNMYFGAAGTFVGKWAEDAMWILIVTSLLACAAAFHNACARYFFALGREGVLPKRLGRAHPKYQSAYVGSVLQTIISLVVVTAFVIARADPYVQLLLWTNGFAIMGIVLVQILCLIAVVGFFRRDRLGHNLFRVVVAPILGAIGLATGAYLMLSNFDMLTGTTGWLNWFIALMLPTAFAIGVVLAYRIKGSNPRQYELLGTGGAAADEAS
jgi:amino acid transporter